MFADLILVIAVGAVVAYLIRSLKSVSSKRTSTTKRYSLSSEENLEVVSSTTPAAEDPFVSGIARTRQRVEAETKADTKIFKETFGDDSGSESSVKDELTRVARINRLDDALILLADEIMNYPPSSKDQNLERLNAIGIIDLSCSEDLDSQEAQFKWRDTNLKVVECSHNGLEGDIYTTFSLFETGEEVFAITCSSENVGYGMQHQCLTIDAFKKRGTWTEALLTLRAKIELEHNKLRIRDSYLQADKIAKRFDK